MWRGALLLGLCLLTFGLGLGRTAIADADEAYYAEAGREMIASGDWITPRYNFTDRLNKPILFYWLVAGTYEVLGVTETAARLWAALAGVGLSFVAYGVGRRWASEDTGLLAGAIVATSLGAVLIGRQALPDMPLAFFISVTIWAAMEATNLMPASTAARAPASPAVRRGWALLCAAAAGFGMLTKGPIAIALPAMALAPWWLWQRAAMRRRRASARWFPLSLSDIAMATAVFLVIAAPWYIAVTRVHGAEFLRAFFIGENLDRFTSEHFNERRGLWFYAGVLAGGLMPWTIFAGLWIQPLRDIVGRRRAISPDAVRLGAWLLGPAALLAASVGSQPRYILPCLVPLALLLARSILRAMRVPRPRIATWLTATAGFVVIAFSAVILRVSPLLLAGDPGWTPLGAWLTCAAGLGVVLAAFVARRFVPAVLVAAAATMVLTINLTVLSLPRPEAVEMMADAVRAQSPDAPVCVCGGFAKNLVFYAHSPIVVGENEEALRVFAQQPGEQLIVSDAIRVAAVEATDHRVFRRLADLPYVPAWWEKPKQPILHPDPAQYVHRVLLVTTR